MDLNKINKKQCNTLVTINPYGSLLAEQFVCYFELLTKVQLDQECDDEWERVLLKEDRQRFEQAGFESNIALLQRKTIEGLSQFRSYTVGSVLHVDFATLYPSVQIRYAKNEAIYEAIMERLVSDAVRKSMADNQNFTAIKIRLNGYEHECWVGNELVEEAVSFLPEDLRNSLEVVDDEPFVVSKLLDKNPNKKLAQLDRVNEVLLAFGRMDFLQKNDSTEFYSDEYELGMHIKPVLCGRDLESYEILLTSQFMEISPIIDDFKTPVENIVKQLKAALDQQDNQL